MNRSAKFIFGSYRDWIFSLDIKIPQFCQFRELYGGDAFQD
jgi:hypothetical protein